MIKENNQGILVVVSGPSGCGKSTLNDLLLRSRKNITMSISDTTRNPRGEEKDGVEYNFLTKEQFEKNIENDKYLEYATVHSHYYGTPKHNIMPPSMEILKNRLMGRKTETKEQLVERFKTAYKEINEVTKYNYVIVNDDLNESLLKMNSILECERCRVDRIEDVYLGNQEEMIHELLVDFDKKN